MDLKLKIEGRFKLDPARFRLSPASQPGLRLRPALANKTIPQLARMMDAAMHRTPRKPLSPLEQEMSAALRRLRQAPARFGVVGQTEAGRVWDSRSPGPVPAGRTLVRSKNLHAVVYDPQRVALGVEFRDGSVYEYHQVPPSVYEGLMRAGSHGGFFHAQVKGRYSCRNLAR